VIVAQQGPFHGLDGADGHVCRCYRKRITRRSVPVRRFLPIRGPPQAGTPLTVMPAPS
jgi:hypothetical protein